MNSSVDLDHAFARCRTLLDALLTVNSLGIRSGLISINSQGTHGWVAFESKQIVKAVVVETGQSGRGALRALSAVDGATYGYKPPEIERDDQQVAETTVQVGQDQTTMVFDDQVVVFRNSQQAAAQGDLHGHLQNSMTEAEFRRGVFGEDDPRDVFMKKDNWLSNTDPPLKDFVQHRPEELAPPADAEPEFNLFAQAGFAIDFRDPITKSSQADLSGGTVAAWKEEKKKIARKRFALLKLLAPFALAFGAFLGYLSSVREGRLPPPVEPLSQTASNHGRASFELPPGETVSTPPVSKRTSAAVSGSPPPTKAGAKAAAGPRVAEPADAQEFALARDRSGLLRLEKLIRDYMLKKNYKHARDLAGAGFRSPVATPEEKQRFYLLYSECVNIITGRRPNAPVKSDTPPHLERFASHGHWNPPPAK